MAKKTIYNLCKKKYKKILSMWNDKRSATTLMSDFKGEIGFKCDEGHEFQSTIADIIARYNAKYLKVLYDDFFAFHLPCPICEKEMKNAFLQMIDKDSSEIKSIPQFKDNEVLMIDIETNGLNSKCHDILEIAIYKPDEDKCFHKYLPLTKQNIVLTTRFNGITEETLKDATHINEEEMKILVDEFEITKRTLLHYGTLDASFMKEYFKFIKLPNRTKVKFYNFKQNIYSSKFSGGNITKDNLCRALGFENIKDIHDAQNDCLLQWKLFKAMDNKPWFITSKCIDVYDIYKYNPDYYMPASYIGSFGRIHELIGAKVPTMQLVKTKDVISMDLPDILNKYNPWLVSYFLGNIMEKQIKLFLNAKDLDLESFIWCSKNKSCIEKVGSFTISKEPVVEYAFKKDGKIEVFGDKTQKEIVHFLTVIVNRLKHRIEEEGLSCEITKDGVYCCFADEKKCLFDLSIFPDISFEIKCSEIDNIENVIVYGNNNLLIESISNEFIDIVQPYAKEFADKIKYSIFREKQIYSQENVISEKYHTLALCDFSNEHAIMEMKVSTSPWFTKNYSTQCLLQSIGKPVIKHFEPILKTFVDTDLIGEKRREFYLCVHNAEEQKLTVSEYHFERKLNSYQDKKFRTYAKKFECDHPEMW